MDFSGQSQNNLSLEDLAAFTSSAFVFILFLLNRVLVDVTTPRLHGLSNVWTALELPLIELNSRKRKHEDATRPEILSHYLSMLKSFLCFHRQINSPSYIKPRSINWCALCMEFVPTDDLERFRQFFRMSLHLFHYICLVVHLDMVTKPPLGLASLPNQKLAVEQ